MSDSLEDVYRDLGNMTRDEILGLMGKLLDDITPSLEKYGDDVKSVFTGYLFTIVGADGKVRQEEFEVIKPVIDAVFDVDSTLADAEELVIGNGFTDEGVRGHFRNIFGQFKRDDSEFANRMILLALCIAVVDGEISEREKAFIGSLL